jgi:ubiquinone/menaquinone biosynthesis C-methylase UbiE
MRKELLRKLKEYYEIQGKKAVFDSYIGSWKVENALFKRRREVIRSMLPKIGNGVALDLGCGVGIYSLDLHKIGYVVISLDISKSYLEKVRSLRITWFKVSRDDEWRWHLINANAEYLPFRDNSLDFILCSEVLEHVPNIFKAPREIIRCLKPGGILVLSIPSSLSFTEKFLSGEEHLHKINPIWLREFLCANGFSLIQEKHCNFAIRPLRRALFKLKMPSFFENFILRLWLELDKLIGRIPIVKFTSWCYVAKFKKIETVKT